nr:hypothetical protein [Tanacetum cinerariifolium]
MRIEQYLTHTDYALWEVIVNDDAPTAIASVNGGAEATIPPKSTVEEIARRNELKAKREAGVVDCSELFYGIVELLVDGASCSTIVEDCEPVKSAFTGGITSTIGAIASRA